ncbi:MAG: MMPL family transporter [Acidimicrobiia bacterium]|nr:MMPL family transporter [Acidimicrobiia bacterium]
MTMRLHRLGLAVAAHPFRTILVWVLVAAALLAAGEATKGEYDDNFKVPGTQSQAAIDRLKADFPTAAGSTDNQIVFHARQGTLGSAPFQAAIGASLHSVSRLPYVVAVVPPVPGRSVSPAGGVGFATVAFSRPAVDLQKNDEFSKMEAAMTPAVRAGVQVEYGGELVSLEEAPSGSSSEGIGLAAALVVMLLAFGSVIAAGLPLATALVGLGVGLGVVKLLSAAVDVPSSAPILGTMIGLGVGIDYALFVVTRQRENLADGMAVRDAVAHTNATAGQSVAFAGTTVVIAICGLALSGIPLVATMGFTTAIIVAVAVLAAVTLMPALLGLLGTRLDSWELPWARRAEREARLGSPRETFWGRWADHVGRRPVRYGLVALLVVVTLAIPFSSMRLGQTDAGTLPKSSTQRRAYDLLAAAFGPGFNGPLTLVAELPATGDRAVVARIESTVGSDPDVATLSPPTFSPSGRTAVLSAVPKSSPESAATSTLVHRLRNSTLPAATAGSGATALVTGTTAVFIDLSSKVASRLPIFIGAVVALSFLLLLVVFRSVLVPLKAAILNVLSICAAYGVVVAVFQWGWFKGLFGLETTVPIVSFVPMMMFAILFGLSMDYEVFLLSRIREEWLETSDNHFSVVDGLAHTAKPITSAAVIMVTVFASFVLLHNPTVQMVGLGLAVAVLVDATLIRMVLVPATMALLGPANWWVPRFLDRVLPRVDIEGSSLARPVPRRQGAAHARKSAHTSHASRT